MSVQIFLQGKLLGIDEFVLAPAAGDEERVFAGRSQWIALLSEVLPRALLAELGLARILIGASGGGQFLVVLPEEARAQAEEFLTGAAAGVARLSGSHVRLVWSITENLGDWSVVRRRLFDGLERKKASPVAISGGETFAGFAGLDQPADEYFGGELGVQLRDASSAGWSPDAPATIYTRAAKHTWSLGDSIDGLSLARHTAPSDDGARPASRQTLASRASGRAIWGVLRGDVDNFGIRLRRAQTIEEHIQLSVMLKQFFAGELEVLCSMGEYWRKVTILYSGGDDFAVYGAWDALIPLAREIQRLFNRLSEEGMKDFAGREGKTVTMAMSLAPDPDASLAGAEDVERLRRALGALPVAYREAIVLCDLQELSYEDAAAAAGCAIGTIRSRLHRGRAQLLAAMRGGRRAFARRPIMGWI